MYAGFYEEGDACPEHKCVGVLGFKPVENCSCHIAPPCGGCTNNRLECSECGWKDDAPEDFHDVPVAPGLAVREYRPKPLDNSRIDYRTKSHSNCSMLVEGVYPAGATRDEVLAVVKGTFGGRFTQFGKGQFTYIAYTD